MNELHVYIRMADTLVLEAKPKPKPPQHPPVPQQPHPQHHSPGDENVVERLQKPRSRLVGVRQRTNYIDIANSCQKDLNLTSMAGVIL